jgi:hypothetical protein
VGSYVCTANKGSLYQQFHVNVPGSGQLNDAARIFNQIAGEYEQHQQDLVNALSTIRATYSGNAASQMEGAFKPLVDALGEGQTIAKRSASTLDTQAGHFGAAQAAIKDHVSVPDAPWYEPIDPFDTAHDDAVQKNSDIDSMNQAAFRKYADDTSNNYGSAPTFPSSAVGSGDVSVSGGSQVHAGGGPGVSGPTVGGAGGSASGGGYGGCGGGSQAGGAPYAGGGWQGRNAFVPPQDGGGTTATQGYAPPSMTGRPTAGPGWPSGGAPAGGGPTGGGFGFGPGYGGFGGGPGGAGFDGAGGGRFGGGTGYGSRGPGGYAGRGPGGGSAGEGARGPGAMSGAGAAEEGFAARQGGLAVGGRAGAPGAAGIGGMGGVGGRKEEEEDREHRSAAYLVDESHTDEIVGDLPRTAPPVIG